VWVWSARRGWPWCWPRPSWRSSAAIASTRFAATIRRIGTTSRAGSATPSGAAGYTTPMHDISVKLGPRSYRIVVDAGILGRVGPELKGLGVGAKVALFSDAGILARLGARVRGDLGDAGLRCT